MYINHDNSFKDALKIWFMIHVFMYM